MELIKAQRLLIKIQAFLDTGNGHELSRLEKDLMKSYIIQLYDAISSEEHEWAKDSPKQVEKPVARVERVEIPPVHIPEIPKPIEIIPEYIEPKVQKPVEVIPEKPVYVPEPVYIPEPIYVAPKPEPIYTEAPVFNLANEVKQKTQTLSSAGEHSEALVKLFELSGVEDVSDRFSHIPVANIEAALGLNERIFTLNELFGGDRGLFESTCAELNNLQTYAQAKAVLLSGPAVQFKWSDPERIKMAEHFIRIVSRRYPKS